MYFIASQSKEASSANIIPWYIPRYCDAYIQLQLGTKLIKDVGSLVRKTRNPRFCKIYNLETTLPNYVELSVSLYDFEATEEKNDKLIGETKIDIEDRFLSIKRPICSLTERYMMYVEVKNSQHILTSQNFNDNTNGSIFLCTSNRNSLT